MIRWKRNVRLAGLLRRWARSIYERAATAWTSYLSAPESPEEPEPGAMIPVPTIEAVFMEHPYFDHPQNPGGIMPKPIEPASPAEVTLKSTENAIRRTQGALRDCHELVGLMGEELFGDPLPIPEEGDQGEPRRGGFLHYLEDEAADADDSASALRSRLQRLAHRFGLEGLTQTQVAETGGPEPEVPESRSLARRGH